MRNFTIIEAEQRSQEWRRARLGRLTGSRAGDVLATIKSGEAAARRDYRIELVCELLTGLSQDDGYINAAIQRGIDMEPMARAAYEAAAGVFVRSTGFLAHNDIKAGASLDGDVDDFTGIVELKAPKTATHLRYLRSGTLPTEHLPQVLNNLWISGAAWCDFASFDDRMPEGLQLFVVRVVRDEAAIADYERKALAFLQEVDRECEAVQTLSNLRGQLEAAVTR